MKKYRVEIFDNNFTKYNQSEFQNKKLDEIGINIEDILNEYFADEIEEGCKLHSITPKYNEDNELEYHIVVFSNDNQDIYEDAMDVKFNLPGIEEPKLFVFPKKDIETMFLCGIVNIDGQEYSIKKKVFKVIEDEYDEIYVECELL